MPDAPSPRDLLAETMAGGRKVIVPHLAEMLKTRRVQELGSSEERRRFWQPAITDAEEQQMWRDEMAARGLTALVPGSPAAVDIGLKVSKVKYPDRWDMAPQEGRDTDSAQAEWAARHMRLGPPKVESNATTEA